MINPKAFGEELAVIVKAATVPLIARINALEKQISDMPVPRDGKDADPAEVAKMVADDVRKDIEALRQSVEAIPEVPEMPELPDIGAMISEGLAEAVALLPEPKDGVDGKDGTSVTAEDVFPAVEKHVDEFLAAIPAPKDGADGKDGAPGEKGDAGADGKDGAGIADLLIDRDGNLTATFTDGRMKALGVVIGKDGAPGKDGADGIGFDDMDIDHDGERKFTFRFKRGAKIIERSFEVPATIYRGVYSSEKEYARGDSVTYGGSQWIALEKTTARPDSGSGWQLAVKKGRDGKDGEMKATSEPKQVKVS